MKTYIVISESSFWSTKKLKQNVENTINTKTKEGWELVSVSFGFNTWWILTSFITLCKQVEKNN